MTQSEAIRKIEECGRRTTMLLLTLQNTLPILKKNATGNINEECLRLIEQSFNDAKKILWDEQQK